MTTKHIHILCEMQFTSGYIRLWDGVGPYMDADGEIWSGMVVSDLDQVESALNWESSTLSLTLSGVDPRISALAYGDLEAGDVIGTVVRIMIQPLDVWDMPVGDSEVRFTGKIDNLILVDQVASEGVVSTITAEITNRATLRSVISGSVLSDVDQQARSAVLNPGADPDRFAERIKGLADKTLVWPRFS